MYIGLTDHGVGCLMVADGRWEGLGETGGLQAATDSRQLTDANLAV